MNGADELADKSILTLTGQRRCLHGWHGDARYKDHIVLVSRAIFNYQLGEDLPDGEPLHRGDFRTLQREGRCIASCRSIQGVQSTAGIMRRMSSSSMLQPTAWN